MARPKKEAVACAIQDCPQTAVAKGYCMKHYQRFLKHGDPSIVLRRGTQQKIEEAEQEREQVQANKGGRPQILLVPKPEQVDGRKVCVAIGCLEPQYGMGVCQRHYMEWNMEAVTPLNQERQGRKK